MMGRREHNEKVSWIELYHNEEDSKKRAYESGDGPVEEIRASFQDSEKSSSEGEEARSDCGSESRAKAPRLSNLDRNFVALMQEIESPVRLWQRPAESGDFARANSSNSLAAATFSPNENIPERIKTSPISTFGHGNSSALGLQPRQQAYMEIPAAFPHGQHVFYDNGMRANGMTHGMSRQGPSTKATPQQPPLIGSHMYAFSPFGFTPTHVTYPFNQACQAHPHHQAGNFHMPPTHAVPGTSSHDAIGQHPHQFASLYAPQDVPTFQPHNSMHSMSNGSMHSTSNGSMHSDIQPRPSPASQHAKVESSSHPGGHHPPALMFVDRDIDILSDYQIFLRKNIEFFEADQNEVKTAMPGRKKPVTLRQVGLRCVHCANVRIQRRTSATVYFPTKLKGLYQAAQNIGTTHFRNSCKNLPEEQKKLLNMYQVDGKRATAGHGGKQYWSDAAMSLGIVETENGLRFFTSES
jgi:hypothetical protein